MIKLDDLKEGSAINILETYNGNNPYIGQFKNKLIKNGKIKLTDNQVTYIIDNYEKDPVKIDRVIKISEYLGEELKKNESISFTPNKILIEYILAETEKTFHIYGKIKKNQDKGKLYWLPKTQVLEDPYFEEINVEVDFEKYKEMDSLKRTPFEHQKSGIKFLLGRKGCILGDDMGLGKAQPLDSKILTPNGWKTMGEIKINDEIIGSNGTPTKITGVFPQGIKPIYKITFTDGSTVESCNEHLWAVQTTNHKKRNNGFMVKPLYDIINDLTWGTKGNIKWYIPMVNPIQFEKKNVGLDPYILGCILGDGCLRQNRVILTSADKEIIDEINIRLPKGHTIKKIKSSIYDYRISSEIHLDRCKVVNDVKEHLKLLRLMDTKSDNKFIPNSYKYNSLDIRLNVLQGLLDTDGSCFNSDGTIQYYTVSKRLCSDVKEIIQSLGGIAKETSKIGKYKLSDDTIKECKRCYVLTINLPKGLVPFKLQRKIDNMKVVRKYLPYRGIKKVEFSRDCEAQCISVEAEDSLYVTNDYILTHNTYQAIIASIESGAERILIVCPSSLKINWEREINCFSDKTAIVNGKKWTKSKFTIINYDILKNFHTLSKKKIKGDPEDLIDEVKDDLIKAKFDMVIVDEAHYLKNHKSIRGEIMTELCVKYGVEWVWLLTGTPVANRPMDYFNLLNLVKSPIANNWQFFAKRYCDGKRFFKNLKSGGKKQIWITDGASNLDELASKTKNIFLRRKKEDVLDMPDKMIIPVHHQLSKSGWSTYNNLWDEYLEKRKKEGKKGSIQRDLVELILLRKHIAMEAIPNTIELAKNAIEQNQKVVIFTNFTDELLELSEEFGKECVIHYGPMNSTNKQISVDKFQNDDKIKVFIGNIKSAGVGITLTSGTVVIFNSYDWVPGNNQQCEDRCFRIGQKNNVTVYYQLFDDTISSRIWETLRNKKDIIETIIGGKPDIDEGEIMSTVMDVLNEKG